MTDIPNTAEMNAAAERHPQFLEQLLAMSIRGRERYVRLLAPHVKDATELEDLRLVHKYADIVDLARLFR